MKEIGLENSILPSAVEIPISDHFKYPEFLWILAWGKMKITHQEL